MTNMLRSLRFMFLLLALPIIASGQYTGSNPNVAAFKLVTASDSVLVDVPANAVDTLETTIASIPGTAPGFLEISLGGYFTVDGFALILTEAGELPTGFTFQVSEDGASWTDLGNYTIGSTGTYGYDVVHADPVGHVRIYMTAKDDPASFAEVEVYGEQILVPPKPVAKDATGITSTGFIANWFERPTADGYRLDVATDINFLNILPGYNNLYTGPVLFKEVSGLNPGQTYYYRIRAYNIAGTTENSNRITVTLEKQDQTITFGSLPAVTYGNADFDLTASASSGLPVSYASSDPSVASLSGNTVTVVGAGSTTLTASQAGNDEYNAADPVDQVLVVNQKELTVTAIADNKPYDGTTAAVISSAVLNGVLGSDDVSLSGAGEGTFAQAGAGTDIAVSTSMTLAGTDRDHYALVQPSGLTADITPKELTVSGVVAADKEYDGTTDAVVTGGTLEGVVSGDDVSLTSLSAAVFAQAGAGTGIGITTSFGLLGADAANYSVAQPAGVTADITPKVLTVGAVAENKVYDGTTAAVIGSANLLGALPGDNVELAGETTGTFAQADAGNNIAVTTAMTLSGSDAGNYSVTQPSLTANITPKELVVTADDASREECGDNPEFSVTYAGFVAGEDAAVIDSEPVASTSANASSAPGAYDITLSGGSDNNYSFSFESGTMTIFPDVTEPVLEVKSATIQLDGSGNATLSPADVVTSAADNCAVTDTTLSKSDFGSGDVGTVNVEVTVTDERGNSASAFAAVTVQPATGLDPAGIADIRVFPNPVSDILTLEKDGYREVSLRITSLNGEVITEARFSGSSYQVDVSMLDKGVYFLTLENDNRVMVRKIVKL